MSHGTFSQPLIWNYFNAVFIRGFLRFPNYSLIGAVSRVFPCVPLLKHDEYFAFFSAIPPPGKIEKRRRRRRCRRRPVAPLHFSALLFQTPFF